MHRIGVRVELGYDQILSRSLYNSAAGGIFCGLSEAAGGGFYGLTGAMEKPSHGNQGAANDLELAVDLDGATRQAPRYAP